MNALSERLKKNAAFASTAALASRFDVWARHAADASLNPSESASR